MSRRLQALLSLIVLFAVCASAQNNQAPQAPRRGERAIMAREATIYVNPGMNSQKLENVARGREVTILDRSGEWLNVFAAVDRQRDVTGWIRDKGVIRQGQKDGDKILYGEAVDSENEAQQRRGRKGAAQDAMRLYYRTAEYFPDSPLAAEAMYRAADIRWQLEKDEYSNRPSSRAADPSLKPEIDTTWFKELKKKYPTSKWAEVADYQMLDNKFCGDWQGESKCPEKETEHLEGYIKDHPNSTKVPEALYEAARRQAALVEIYKTKNDAGKSEKAKQHAQQLAQRLVSQFPQSDFTPRAYRLLYMMEQGLPTFGPENKD